MTEVVHYDSSTAHVHHAAAPEGVVTTSVEVHHEEKHSLDKQRKERIEQRRREKEEAKKKGVVYAVPEAVTAIRRTPGVLVQGASLGSQMAALAWEQPERSFALVRSTMAAMKEGAEVAVQERETLSSTVQHGQGAAAQVQAVADKAPDSVDSAVDAASAAATDIVEGVKQPSAGKLGQGGVEGAQSVGSAGAAGAQAPGNVFAAAQQAMMAAANAASVPLRAPVKAMRTAWISTQAAGNAALLTAAAPGEVMGAANAVQAAAKEVGAAARSALGAANRTPGGTVVHSAVVVLLLPLVLGAVLTGLVVGVSWEVFGRAAGTLTAFMSSCVAAAAHALAWRFEVTPAEAEEMMLVPDDVVHVVQGETTVDLSERAQSLVLDSAREALLSARAREERQRREQQRKAAGNNPMKAVQGALAAAGRALGNLAFWQRGNKDRRREEQRRKQQQQQQWADDAAAAVTSSQVAQEPPQESVLTTPQKQGSGISRVSIGSNSGGSTSASGSALKTPAGPLLPLIGIGLAGTPYDIPTLRKLWQYLWHPAADENMEAPELRHTTASAAAPTSTSTITTTAALVPPAAASVASVPDLTKEKDPEAIKAALVESEECPNPLITAAAAGTAETAVTTGTGYAGDDTPIEQHMQLQQKEEVEQHSNVKLQHQDELHHGEADAAAAAARRAVESRAVEAASMAAAAAGGVAPTPSSSLSSSSELSDTKEAADEEVDSHPVLATEPPQEAKRKGSTTMDAKGHHTSGWSPATQLHSLYNLSVDIFSLIREAIPAAAQATWDSGMLLVKSFTQPTTSAAPSPADADDTASLVVSKMAAFMSAGSERATRLGALLMQPAVLGLALVLAMADTVVWKISRASRNKPLAN